MVDALLGLVDPWLYVFVFLLALAEGAVLLGLFLPGESAMLLAGFLVSQGRVSLAAVITVAVIGSVLGDSIGYWTGRRFGGGLRNTRLGRRIGAGRWRKVELFMRDRGRSAVSIGRFIGFLRTLVPPLAGSCHMPYRDFVTFNAPAAALWAVIFILVGVLVGDGWDAIAHWTGWAGKVIAALMLGGTAAVFAFRSVRRLTIRSVAEKDIRGSAPQDRSAA